MRPHLYAAVQRAAMAFCLVVGWGVPRLLAAPAESQTIPLEWRTVAHAYHAFTLYDGQDLQPSTATKLPGKTSELFCRTVRLGKQTVLVAINRAQATLYIDANRNSDLTDDPTAVYHGSKQDNNLTFTNISLPFSDTASGLAADLVLLPYNYLILNPKSYYSAKASLGGRDYEVGLLLETSQYTRVPRLLLRPWEERDRPLLAAPEIPEAFPLPARIFLNGQLYGLATNAAAGKPALEWSHLPAPPTGELQLAGSGIYRLILHDKVPLQEPDTTVVLDQPGLTAKVPTGNYRQIILWRRSEQAAAVNTEHAASVVVTAGKSTPLEIGSALTNQVALGRQGSTLSLSYKLLGANGAAYTLYPQDRTKPPQFKVLKHQQQVLSGAFAYG